MNILRDYAMQFVGVPYRWAGDDPMAGYDCSGFIQELLASVGLDPPGDQTAQGLFDHYDRIGERSPAPNIGVLTFYGESVSKIVHVAMLIDPYRIVEAGSGGHLTNSEEAAIKHNAYVRVRHLIQRKPIAMRKPRYAIIGML